MNLPPCTLEQISEHVYWFTPEPRTDRPSLAVVVGEKANLMLDIGASPTHTKEFLAALTEKEIPKPNYAILSHWHWDHWFGIEALDMPVFAYQETAQNIQRQMIYDFSNKGLEAQVAQGLEIAFCMEHMLIEMDENQRKNLKLRVPDKVFNRKIEFDLGGVICTVEHILSDHASDSCVIYIPEDKVLFLGDCLYPNIYKEPRHYTKSNLVPLIRKIESFGAEKFIEGHSSQIMPQDLIQSYFDWIDFIYQSIDKHGIENEALLETLMREHSNNDEDALDFLRDILSGEKYYKGV